METNRNWETRFFTLWTGQAFSLLGSQLVQFTIIWYLTQRTHSATTLATVSLMGLIPQALLPPFIGTWVDRGNRRAILIAADSTVAIVTLIPVILFSTGRIEVWHIYVVLFIRAVASGFHQSAFGASVVLLVPQNQPARVQGFNQALFGGLNIISAPLGAYRYAVLPLHAILAIDVVTALIAIGTLLIFHIPQPQRDGRASVTFRQDLAAGYRYIAAWRGLVIVLLMAKAINFFYGAA